MSTKKAREAEEARRRAHRAHMKHVLGIDQERSMNACRACGRGTHGRFCYWCGKRRGLW